MTNPTNKEELVARLDGIARDFRQHADEIADSYSGAHGEVRSMSHDRLAEFAETVLCLLRATPESPHNPGQGDGG